MNESQLVSAVESCSLPIDAFTHAEHVRLGWSYLNELPLLTALATFRDTLQGFAAHHGKATLYHETIRDPQARAGFVMPLTGAARRAA